MQTDLTNTCFKIITLQDLCCTAKVVECINMCCDPAFLIHREKCFNIRVSAVRQYSYKDICLDHFTGIGINYSCCINKKKRSIR